MLLEGAKAAQSLDHTLGIEWNSLALSFFLSSLKDQCRYNDATVSLSVLHTRPHRQVREVVTIFDA